MTKFRLTRLLRLKEIAADRAAQELALARRRENQAQAKVDRAQAHVFGTELEAPGSVWPAIVAARTATMAMAREAAAAHHACQSDSAAQAVALDQARQQVKPLEKLEEKFHRDQNAQDLAAQAVVLDEVGQNMFLRKQVDNVEL